jgi:microcystin-dependent protein
VSNPFVAEIRIFPFNFAPRGWAFCDGQLLPISQNTALFSLVGTFYGGDGKSTFALPNFQGSVPIHQGQGPGLSEYVLGEQGGAEFVTLLTTEMPVHTHTMRNERTDPGDVSIPSPTAAYAGGEAIYHDVVANQTVQFAPQALTVAGSSFPHNNMMPYLTLNFCIAMQGVFPQRP